MLYHQQIAGYLTKPDTYATTIIVAMLDEFGTDFLEWEPETIRLEIENTYSVEPHPVVIDKLWAMITVLTTNQFLNNLDAFTHICHALSGQLADFHNYNPAEVDEICWAMLEVNLVDPPDPKESFNAEIVEYVKLKLQDESFTRTPAMLKKFVGDVESNEFIDSALEADGIDTKSHWDDQTKKCLALDQELQFKLSALIQQVAGLPLQHADKQALSTLKERADKALAKRLQEIRREQATVKAPAFQ